MLSAAILRLTETVVQTKASAALEELAAMTCTAPLSGAAEHADRVQVANQVLPLRVLKALAAAADAAAAVAGQAADMQSRATVLPCLAKAVAGCGATTG